MRATLDAHILSPHHPVRPLSGRTSSGTRQSATFQHILQQQAAPPPATTAPSTPATAFANFGSTPNGPDPTGGQSYNPISNPLLTAQTSSTDLNGTLVTQNTSPTVTASAAQQFAAVLGGTVVGLQTPWANAAPVYGIELPSGEVIDGTAIANILGNNAAYPSAAVKSGEIAKLMGVQYTPALVNLAMQLAGGANASLQPLDTGPGVMSPPVLTPADGRGSVPPISSGG
jgi:hypothetical protein